GGRRGRDGGLYTVETPRVALPGGRRRRSERIVGARLGQTGRQDHVAGHNAAEERRFLLRGTEARDGKHAERERRPERNGCDRRSRLLEDEAHLNDAAADASVVLADADAEEVRASELGPQRAVEPIGRGFDLFQSVGRHVTVEDVAREPGDRLLLFAEGKVHGPQPIPAGRKSGSVRSPSK